jgi:hypothetical protein
MSVKCESHVTGPPDVPADLRFATGSATVYVLLFGEAPDLFLILGCGFILSGVAVTSRQKR